MVCEKCGSPMQSKSGVSKKNGKAWGGNFCDNPECKHVVWNRAGSGGTGGGYSSKQAVATPSKPYNGKSKEQQASITALAIIKAKAVAGGYSSADGDMLEKMYMDYQSIKQRESSNDTVPF